MALDTLRLPAIVIVPISPVFRGMKSHHDSTAPVIFSLNDSFSAEPVVPMHYIEACVLIGFGLAHKINKAVAHIVHLCDKIRMQSMGQRW